MRAMDDLEAAVRCVTWQMRDFAGCLARGAHLADDLDHSECDGCAPALRSVGGLCSACWTRVEQVVADWDAWEAVLGDEPRAFTPEPVGRSTPGPRIPWSRMQVDVAVVRGLDTRRGALARNWVSNDRGAMDALRFARAAASTMREHPRVEGSRRLGRTQCPKCKVLSLIYRPPAAPGSDATVVCAICGYTIDGDRYEVLAAIEAQCCRRCKSEQGCAEAGCRCHVSAPVPAWQQSSRPSETIVLEPGNAWHRRLRAELLEERP